jgi:hypothetical protein
MLSSDSTSARYSALVAVVVANASLLPGEGGSQIVAVVRAFQGSGRHMASQSPLSFTAGTARRPHTVDSDARDSVGHVACARRMGKGRCWMARTAF